jgi:hypothetical protein
MVPIPLIALTSILRIRPLSQTPEVHLPEISHRMSRR